MRTTGERLQEWRLAQGLSQAGLVDALGAIGVVTNQAKISLVESDKSPPGLALALGLEELTAKGEHPIASGDWVSRKTGHHEKPSRTRRRARRAAA